MQLCNYTCTNRIKWLKSAYQSFRKTGTARSSSRCSKMMRAGWTRQTLPTARVSGCVNGVTGNSKIRQYKLIIMYCHTFSSHRSAWPSLTITVKPKSSQFLKSWLCFLSRKLEMMYTILILTHYQFERLIERNIPEDKCKLQFISEASFHIVWIEHGHNVISGKHRCLD